MCARYEFSHTPKQMAERFLLESPPDLLARGEIRPTNRSIVIGPGPRARHPAWGLEGPWGRQPVINARAETLREKPLFQPLLENRCVVPATAYFEWRQVGGEKLKNRIGDPNGDLLALAGLTDGDRFVIITRSPSPDVAHIHERMPAILSGEGEAAWLDPEVPFGAVATCLTEAPPPPLSAEEEAPKGPPQLDLFG